MKLGALELDMNQSEQQGLSPALADVPQNTATAAAAAVLESGNSLSGECASADIATYSLPQPAHIDSQHVAPRVADLSALPGHDMLGTRGIPKNGISQATMGSAVVPPQAGGFVPDRLSGYHRHSVLARAAGNYTQHQGSDYGAMASHAMLAGGSHMQYSPAVTMSFSGGAHMASQQMRPSQGQPPAMGNNRQNVPPNVPPMAHDEVFRLFDYAWISDPFAHLMCGGQLFWRRAGHLNGLASTFRTELVLALQVWNMWGQPSVPGGIRDLWQSDMGMQDPKKALPPSFGNAHQNGQFSYNMGAVQQDFGYSHSQPPYYPMDGRQGSRGGFREY